MIMKDGQNIKGKIITYKEEKYEIGDVYVIANNPELYVQLKKDGTSMNVKMSNILTKNIDIVK